jgi:hypothetical protein
MREGLAGCGAQAVSDCTQTPEGYHDQEDGIDPVPRLVALDPGDFFADPDAR